MDEAVSKKIEETVNGNRIVLFMKGTKDFPQCGFSGRSVQILQNLGVDFTDVNVLEDNSIREGIKEFSDWPTIPQLYVDGEFVGGSDLMLEMYQNGELQDMVKT
jgi:monothiol glutaredoxin